MVHAQHNLSKISKFPQHQGKARQGKARQGKARQGKAKQGKARQGKARQGKVHFSRGIAGRQGWLFRNPKTPANALSTGAAYSLLWRVFFLRFVVVVPLFLYGSLIKR